MDENMNANRDQNMNNKRIFVEPKAYLSKDKNYITLLLPRGIIVRKHCNYFKAIMGLSFEKVIN